jgi:hypothetical protein
MQIIDEACLITDNNTFSKIPRRLNLIDRNPMIQQNLGVESTDRSLVLESYPIGLNDREDLYRNIMF